MAESSILFHDDMVSPKLKYKHQSVDRLSTGSNYVEIRYDSPLQPAGTKHPTNANTAQNFFNKGSPKANTGAVPSVVLPGSNARPPPISRG